MSWHSQVEPAIIQGDFWQVSQFYEELIEREPLEISHYWYLGLAYLLEAREEEAQTTWLFVLSQGDEGEMTAWTADLVNILDGEARRQLELGNLETSWLIRGHIREISPDNVDNLLRFILLAINLNYFEKEQLKTWLFVDVLKTNDCQSIELSLLAEVLEKFLDYQIPETVPYLEAIFQSNCQRQTFIKVVEAKVTSLTMNNKPLAIDIINACLAVEPEQIYLLAELYQCYFDNRDFADAIQVANQLKTSCQGLPSQAVADFIALYVKLFSGNWVDIKADIEEYAESLQKSITNRECPRLLDGPCLSIVSPLVYLEDNPRKNRYINNCVGQLFQEYVRNNYNRHSLQKSTIKDANKVLKIGYIANTLGNHSIGLISRWLMKYHDYNQFHVSLYLVSQKEDFITENDFKNRVNACYNLPIKPLLIAEKISQDNIDILVDLDGITNEATCQVMALKPAPIQVTWLGFDASGIPAIDYYLADNYVLPADAQEYYREKIWRLPNSYICVDGVEVASPSLRRDDLGIPEDAINYLTAQTGVKRNPETIRLQLQILKAVPNSYLSIQGLSDAKSVEKLFFKVAEEEGINYERLKIFPLYPTGIYRANLRIADVVLDTYPFTGGMTTLDVLWMGIPLVTKVGQQWSSRNSYTLMVNAGISEGIAWSDEEYIDWGIKLGKDENLRRKVIAKLDESRQTSPLWNARQFTKNVESAYRQMWQIYCES
ncbi:MAG: O-linked N-acetylglucosamine transferase, SPINDLY family protein [Microcystis sp. M53603_WE2]|jgi:predicted O-linked N-acetylglucosamine transferase (SPINDLY family)|uniref:O-linked N-acetylglucosamine transferase, SPINDLY family protein n=1 Tax=Microcystis aeruginosa KW TaxID=1960155 RepID=A0A1V4BY00_MICAE|nr:MULTISPECIES: O-linked N-acetylglucosamine transferase, SPINDLY family protein [Microcystis]MCE2662272.1 O-linked N-acetylglucosamine transferase, SPINDLY family protein [Microcystis sp. 53602_E8]MDJ0539460.1 O-linked N-acetylglucosamine transferase, SPINDLY family protein [Microcystis sp. M53603_WE2]MDJ0606632.1 O-linked N-acetylglucosamine transferase, SPINDLY family protein [Microcystis sp. M53602_WE12]OPF19543.1 O-linked N-acetylglucosamine transferase, SPINDLY family protein [Microcysti